MVRELNKYLSILIRLSLIVHCTYDSLSSFLLEGERQLVSPLPPVWHLPLFLPLPLIFVFFSASPKGLFSPYKAKWASVGGVAAGMQVSNLVCLRLSGLRENFV